MKYEEAESFRGDLRRLSKDKLRLFKNSIPAFNDACDRWAADQTPFPGSLRVGPVKSVPGAWEMTWSFAGPDGRAMFEWISLEDASPAIRWLRVGGHEVFSAP